MKLTKKDLFDGQEMTDRERHERMERNIERHAYFLLGCGIAALILFIAHIIDNLKH